MPKSWTVVQQESGNDCQSINAVYENLGAGTSGNQPQLFDARLDAVLGRAVAPDFEPSELALDYGAAGGVLRVQYLGGRQPYSFSVSATCEDGWLTWRQVRDEHYLADGETLENMDVTYRLRASDDPGLIVHSRGSAVFTTFFMFRNQESFERWSKFKRINN